MLQIREVSPVDFRNYLRGLISPGKTAGYIRMCRSEGCTEADQLLAVSPPNIYS